MPNGFKISIYRKWFTLRMPSEAFTRKGDSNEDKDGRNEGLTELNEQEIPPA